MKNEEKEKILIALCGMSPAVITETVYALVCETKHPPDKIIVITTTLGHEKIKTELFESGVWNDLTDSLNVNMEFSDSNYHIRLIPNSDATGDAKDIVTSEDNNRTADFILETLREFTENPDTQIIFSIAGGRKTMSAIASMAMSLLGREQDILCHVLVNPPFDSPALSPKFYFPDKTRTYLSPDGEKYSAANARITLCALLLSYIFAIFFRKSSTVCRALSATLSIWRMKE